MSYDNQEDSGYQQTSQGQGGFGGDNSGVYLMSLTHQPRAKQSLGMGGGAGAMGSGVAGGYDQSSGGGGNYGSGNNDSFNSGGGQGGNYGSGNTDSFGSSGGQGGYDDNNNNSNSNKTSFGDKAKGTLDQLKGKVTGNQDLQDQGAARKVCHCLGMLSLAQ